MAVLTQSRSSSRVVSSYRPALDGLRALAVLSVFIYHTGIGYLPGGFLGVDLFFVLSGYLITGLLLDQHSLNGSISLKQFWTRRIRRLFPAVLLLILAMSLYAAFFAEPNENYSIRRDGLASLFYSANWWFILTSRSYFEQFSDDSVFRHMWSLAIEEQFYFIWPIVVALLLRRFGSAKSVGAFSIVGLLASSALMQFWFQTASPSRAYFGTDARIHELLVGAVGAILLRNPKVKDRLIKAPRAVSLVSTSSLLLILFMMLAITDQAPSYYQGFAVLFSLATMTLLLSMDIFPSLTQRLFSLKPMVSVGKISYGFYLWHWPIIVLFPLQWLPSGMPYKQLLVIAIELVLTLVISSVSYFVFEKPIRQGSLGRWKLTVKRTFAGFVVMMLVTGSLLFTATASQAVPDWVTKVPPGTFVELGDASPKAPVVAIVGDSIARSMFSGLDTAGKKAGVRIIGSAWAGCGPGVEHLLMADGKSDWEYSTRCDNALPEAYSNMVAKYKPQVVMWHSVIERFPFKRADGSVVVPGTPQYEAAVFENFNLSYKALTSGGAKVLIAEVVLKAQRFKGTCKMQPTKSDCRPDDGSDGVYPGLNARIKKFVASVKGAKVLPISTLICPGGPPCSTYVNGVMLRYDGSHLTAGGSELVGGPLLRLIVKESGIKPLRPAKLSTVSLRPTRR